MQMDNPNQDPWVDNPTKPKPKTSGAWVAKKMLTRTKRGTWVRLGEEVGDWFQPTYTSTNKY